MIKPTPNPPLGSPSNDASVVLLRVKDGIPTEDLLVNLTETLASAHSLTCNFAFELDSSRREGALGVAQLIEVWRSCWLSGYWRVLSRQPLQNRANSKLTIGASLLVKNVNDDAGILSERCVLWFFASKN